MVIKDLEITNWKTHWCPMGTVEVPAKFEAKIEGNETLEEIVEEVKNKLVGKKATKNKGWNWYWPAWEGDYVRIPTKIVTDEEEGLAAFVLVAEIFGEITAIKEGIYGIKKQGEKIRGKLITYDYTYFRGTDNPNYFRHIVNKIENGILKYKKVIDGPEYEYNLKEL